MASEENDNAKFQIFRAKDALSLTDAKCMTIEPFSDVQRDGMNRMMDAGYLNGGETTILCNAPGFSLTHVWFKNNYPLPLHSHDADCMYYIIAGSLRLGTEELGPRDSFFVPCDVPYTYKPGPDGVELIEIRSAPVFNFVNHAKGTGFWDKAVETCTQLQDEWKKAQPPMVNA